MTIKYYARDDTGEYVDLDTYPPEKKQEILAAAGEKYYQAVNRILSYRRARELAGIEDE